MYNAYRPDYVFFTKIETWEVEETLFSVDVIDGNVVKKSHTFKATIRTHMPMMREVGCSAESINKNASPKNDVLYNKEHIFDCIASWRNYLIDTHNLLSEYDVNKKIEDIKNGVERYKGFITEEEKIYALLNQSKNNFDWIEEPKNRQGNILGYFRPSHKYNTDNFGDCIGDFFCPVKTIEVLTDDTDTISIVLGIDEYQRRNTPIGAIVKGRLEVDYTEQTVSHVASNSKKVKKSKKRKKRRRGSSISNLQEKWNNGF